MQTINYKLTNPLYKKWIESKNDGFKNLITNGYDLIHYPYYVMLLRKFGWKMIDKDVHQILSEMINFVQENKNSITKLKIKGGYNDIQLGEAISTHLKANNLEFFLDETDKTKLIEQVNIIYNNKFK